MKSGVCEYLSVLQIVDEKNHSPRWCIDQLVRSDEDAIEVGRRRSEGRLLKLLSGDNEEG
jgi:hypothetical protein